MILPKEKSVGIYFGILSRDKRKKMTQDEEVVLIKKIRSGDKKAYNEFVERNLRFVVLVAKNYQGCGLALADLISEGNVGLLYAIKKFDESKNFKFCSYAVKCIRDRMIDAICNHGKTIRIPKGVHKYGKADNSPNISTTSLDVLVGDKHDTPLESVIADQQTEKHEDDQKTHELFDHVLNIINKMDEFTERERRVIISRYCGDELLTLREVGELINLSYEGVRQIEKNVIQKLQKIMN